VASDNFSLQVDTTGAISTPISAMVDTKLKQQIWKNKFVDLSLLLPQNCVANSRKKGLQFQLVANSTLAVVPNKPKYSIFTIEFWTTAFIRYMAIYAEKFPEAIPHLAKHAEVVRDLASLQHNNAWSVYDQQVRMDRQVRNIPWNTFNMEFYIMATRARDSNNFGGHNQGQRPFRQPLRPSFRGGRQISRGMGRSVRGADFPRLPRGYCWGFNRDGLCRTPNCKFIQKCSECGGEHPSVSCSKQPAEKPNFGTKVTTTKNKTQGPVTPVNYKTLKILLEGYDRDKADMLERGFKDGFKLGYNGQRKFYTSPNLQSASQFPDIVDQKLAKEIAQNRIAGPFRESPYPNLQISPIGVVPKKEEGQFRLIHHLSYPFGSSVNDFIPEEIKQVHYASIDDAISIILAVGPKCALAKTDVSNAFRIIPIHPDDHELLGIKWKGNFYFDRCLPMGCSSSCAIF